MNNHFHGVACLFVDHICVVHDHGHFAAGQHVDCHDG